MIVGTFEPGDDGDNMLDVLVIGLDGATTTSLAFDLDDPELIRIGDHGWLLSLADVQPGLTDGVYDVTATVTNPAGTSETDLTDSELTIITVPPPIPTVDAVGSADGRPLLGGTADSDLPLNIVVNGVLYESGIAPELSQAGDDTWQLDLRALSPLLATGVYNIVAISSDAAGNSSVDVTDDELIVDLQGPLITVVDQQTHITTPTISVKSSRGYSTLSAK